MTQENREGRAVFLSWVLATALGCAAMGLLIFLLPFLQSIPGIVPSSLIIGIPIALGQWIALRRLAPISILWVFTIGIGIPLSMWVLSVVFDGISELMVMDDESVAMMVVSYSVFGFLVGLIQWLLLRLQFPNSLVWILASTAGLGMGFALVLVSDLINISGFISIVVGVLVYASATGLALEWIVRRHTKFFSPLPNAT